MVVWYHTTVCEEESIVQKDCSTMKTRVLSLPLLFLCEVILLLNNVRLCYSFVSEDHRWLKCGRIKPQFKAQQDQPPEATLSTTGGPFERAFPRYRIDLTPVKASSSNNNKLLDQFMPSVLRDWKSQGQREALSRQFPDANVVIVVANDADGAHAMTTLWQCAAQCLQSASDKQFSTIVVVNNNHRLASQFTDLLRWTLVHVPDCRPLHMEVLYLPEHQAVRMTAQPHSPDSQQSSLSSTSSSTTTSTTTSSFNAQVINRRTQAWVQRVLVKMGICPFTKAVRRSGQGLADVGVPVADIVYHASAATNAVTLMADTWAVLQEFLDAGPAAQSSILLAAPAYDDRLDDWTGPLFCLLETSVVVAQAEAALGVVCFHPRYATPDGSSWPGFGHMHSVPRLIQWVRQADSQTSAENFSKSSSSSSQPSLSRTDIAAGGSWQRRTPHATINVLRAEQLAAAEGRRASATLYPRNIRALLAIGSAALQEALEEERQIMS